MYSKHVFDIEEDGLIKRGPGGYRNMVNSQTVSCLGNMAIAVLVLKEGGFREPHWHPNATELNYVLKGKARITLASPHEEVTTYEISQRQGSIIPQGYFHSIENIGEEELHLLCYYNNATTATIGLLGAMHAYSQEVLASLFESEPHFFKEIKRLNEQDLIVTGIG